MMSSRDSRSLPYWDSSLSTAILIPIVLGFGAVFCELSVLRLAVQGSEGPDWGLAWERWTEVHAQGGGGWELSLGLLGLVITLFVGVVVVQVFAPVRDQGTDLELEVAEILRLGTLFVDGLSALLTRQVLVGLVACYRSGPSCVTDLLVSLLALVVTIAVQSRWRPLDEARRQMVSIFATQTQALGEFLRCIQENATRDRGVGRHTRPMAGRHWRPRIWALKIQSWVTAYVVGLFYALGLVVRAAEDPFSLGRLGPLMLWVLAAALPWGVLAWSRRGRIATWTDAAFRTSVMDRASWWVIGGGMGLLATPLLVMAYEGWGQRYGTVAALILISWVACLLSVLLSPRHRRKQGHSIVADDWWEGRLRAVGIRDEALGHISPIDDRALLMLDDWFRAHPRLVEVELSAAQRRLERAQRRVWDSDSSRGVPS